MKKLALLIAFFACNAQAETGIGSWYGPGFHGKKTASGSRFNQHELTAAHRTIPLGSLVKVTNLRTKKHTIVKITDRGPHIKNRIIDLSKGAAQAIGMSGIDLVKLERKK